MDFEAAIKRMFPRCFEETKFGLRRIWPMLILGHLRQIDLGGGRRRRMGRRKAVGELGGW